MRAVRVCVRLVAGLAFASSFAVAAEARAQHCAAPPKAPPSAADMETAKKSMAGGVTFMQDAEGARYEEAYPQFKRAYQLSGSLNALENMAVCASKLELDGEAIECFRRYLEKKGSDIAPDDKLQVESDLRTLEAGVAYVTISSDLPAVTLQDTRTPRRGAVVRNSYKLGSDALRLGLHPGEHLIVASANGHPEQKWTVEVKSGDKLSKEFLFDVGKPVTAEGFTDADAGKTATTEKAPEVASTSSGGLPTSVWVVGGITVASGIGWGVTGALALSKKSAYDDANTPENAAAGVDLDAQQATVKKLNLVADVMMGVTAASAVTTLVLGLTSSGSSAPPKAALVHDWTLTPYASGAGVGALAVGRF